MSELFRAVWFGVTVVFFVYDFAKVAQKDTHVAFAALLPLYATLGAAFAWEFA